MQTENGFCFYQVEEDCPPIPVRHSYVLASIAEILRKMEDDAEEVRKSERRAWGIARTLVQALRACDPQFHKASSAVRDAALAAYSQAVVGDSEDE